MKTKDDAAAGIGLALATIDEAIRKAGNPGEPGSGVHLLLSTVAAQFLGVPHGSFSPTPAPEVEAGAEAEARHKAAEANHKAAEAEAEANHKAAEAAKHSRR